APSPAFDVVRSKRPSLPVNPVAAFPPSPCGMNSSVASAIGVPSSQVKLPFILTGWSLLPQPATPAVRANMAQVSRRRITVLLCFRMRSRNTRRLAVRAGTELVIDHGGNTLREELDGAISEGEVRAARVPRAEAPRHVPVAAVL